MKKISFIFMLIVNQSSTWCSNRSSTGPLCRQRDKSALTLPPKAEFEIHESDCKIYLRNMQNCYGALSNCTNHDNYREIIDCFEYNNYMYNKFPKIGISANNQVHQ